MADETPQDARDWATARSAFEAGQSYRQAEDSVGGRISYGRIRRRALAEHWVQDGLPADADAEARRAQTANATAAAQRKWAVEKERVLSDLVGTIDRLQGQVFAPHRVLDAKVVPQGNGRSEVEVVAIDMAEPSPQDKKALVTSMAILIDKAQLLSGDATSRTETGPIADREAVEARLRQVRDELAERRAANEALEKQAGAQ